MSIIEQALSIVCRACGANPGEPCKGCSENVVHTERLEDLPLPATAVQPERKTAAKKVEAPAGKNMARLMLDFQDERALSDFITALRFHELIPNNATVYEADVLDFRKDTGVTVGNTYVLKAEGDRAKETKLKVTHTVEVTP